MGVRIASSASTAIVNAGIANGVEAVAFTSGPIGLIYDNAQVLIQWMVQVSVGAAAVTVTPRLRRGSTVLGTLLTVVVADAVVASTNQVFSGVYIDTPGIAAGLQYSITFVVTGGAAAIGINDGCIAAMVL